MATIAKFCAPGVFDPATYSQGITTYVTDMRYGVDLAAIREEFLGKKGPASTLVEVSTLAHPDLDDRNRGACRHLSDGQPADEAPPGRGGDTRGGYSLRTA